jgi:hypothetical protein
LITTKNKAGVNQDAILLKRANGFFAGFNAQDFLLTDDGNTDLKSWFAAIQPRVYNCNYNLTISQCIDLGTTRVFGVDLKELKSRPNAKSLIPYVIQNTISHLDCFGLEIEGLFRKSGSASQIEYFREQYDQGITVDLRGCPDPHTVAGLLKLYLRELPEPLLTFDMYDKVVNVLGSTGLLGYER